MAQPIETARLRLLPLSRERIQDVHLLWSDQQAMFWSLSGPTKSLEATQTKLEKFLEPSDPTNRYDWLVYERHPTTTNSETCIGMTAMWKRQPQEPGLVEPGDTWIVSYMLLETFWSKGFATEMTEGMIQGMKETVRPCTLQAYVNPANPPSHRVAEKLGFEVVEKVYRPEEPKIWIGGQWREYDVWRYTRKLE